MSDVAYVACTASRQDDLADNASDFTFSFAAGTADCVIVDIFNYQRDADLVSGVTFNGIAGIRIAYRAASDAGMGLYSYVVPNAGGGTHNVVISKSGTASLLCIARSYNNTNTAATTLGAIIDVFDVASVNEVTALTLHKAITTLTANALVGGAAAASGNSLNVSVVVNAGSIRRTPADAIIGFDIGAVTATPGSVDQGTICGDFRAQEMIVWALLPPSAGTSITGPNISAPPTINQPTLTRGAVAITGPTIAPSVTINAPTITLAPSGTIAVTAPDWANGSGVVQGQLLFVQRTGVTTIKTVAGTYTGAPTGIEWRLGLGAWAAVGSPTLGGNAWSGTVTLADGDDGTLSFRFANDTSTTKSIDVSVGDNFDWGGDSTLLDSGQSYQPAISTGKRCWLWYDAGPYYLNLLDNSGSRAWPAVAQLLRAYTGYCIAFTMYGASGSRIDVSWQQGQSDYVELLDRHTNNGIGAALAMCWHGNSNSVSFGATPSAATFKASLSSFKTAAASDFNATYVLTSMFTDKGNGAWSGDAVQFRADMDAIRQGLINAYGDSTILRGGNGIGIDQSGDNTHPDNTDDDALIFAFDWFYAIVRVCYGGTVRGPLVSHVSTNGVKDTFIVTLDQAIVTKNMATGAIDTTPLTNDVDGFHVENGSGTAATITSAKVTAVNPGQVTIVVSAGQSGTPRVSFGSSRDATAGVIPVGAAQTLPDSIVGLEATYTTFNLPPEVFLDEVADLNQVIVGPNISAPVTINQPVATPGAVTITGPNISAPVTFYTARLHRAGDAISDPAQGVNTCMYVYLHDQVYSATPSSDLTTMIVRQLRELTGDMTARFKSIINSAGTAN